MRKAYQYASADENNFLWLGVRLQTRYSNSSIRIDLLPNEQINSDSDIEASHGHLKLDGHLFIQEFTIYLSMTLLLLHCWIFGQAMNSLTG